MRDNLRRARKAAGLTQQAMADKLGISRRYYEKIENGERNGNFEVWDALEDIFNIHQRVLRALSPNHPGKADRQV